MKELGIGNDKYKLINIDNEDKEISKNRFCKACTILYINYFKFSNILSILKANIFNIRKIYN